MMAQHMQNDVQYLNQKGCQEAADQIISLNLTTENTIEIYKEIK